MGRVVPTHREFGCVHQHYAEQPSAGFQADELFLAVDLVQRLHY